MFNDIPNPYCRYGPEVYGAWHMTGEVGRGTVQVVEVAEHGGGIASITGRHLSTTGKVFWLLMESWSNKRFEFGEMCGGVKYTLYDGHASGHKLAFLSSEKPQGGARIIFHWDSK